MKLRPIAMVAGGALAVLALTAPGAAAAEPGCTLEGSGSTVTQALGDRSYELHVPDGLSGAEVPLLLSLHGFGSSGGQDELFTGWSGFADANNFIVAYPNGRPSWGSGAWDPYTSASADVEFLRSVVDDIAASHCVDPSRVHVDGWSNGAVMSQRVACEAADVFASVSSYGGGSPTIPGAAACMPSRPISVAMFVGQFDFTLPGLAPNTADWVDRNDCSTLPARSTDTHGRTDTYDCAAGTEVVSRVVKNTSHNWPSGARGQDQRQRLWAFFEDNPLP